MSNIKKNSGIPALKKIAFSASQKMEDLLRIMEALRTPGTGCAWDIVQTFETIAPYTLEEAQEVVDAIQRGDRNDLCEELGDLLLQVVFHARIAEEEGSFCFGDVVKAITDKMIRRHPHVFGEQSDLSPEAIKIAWHRIKAEEKAEKSALRLLKGLREPEAGALSGVLPTQPALSRALKLQAKAATVGFDWNNAKLVLDKIREEIAEVEEAMEHKTSLDVHEEIGDLLFAVANLARHVDGDPEALLQAANAKFERRFRAVENAILRSGKRIEDATLDEMEAEWGAVKRGEK